MQKSIHYPLAPIVEAVIDFQLVPNKKFKKSFYPLLQKELASQLKLETELKELAAQIVLNKGQPEITQTNRMAGYRFVGHNGRIVLQAGENRFTFSLLKTYDTWEEFSKLAFKYWNKYRKIFKPEKVLRQGVRYINRIDIPQTKIKLQEYFNIYPSVFESNRPDENIAGFIMQVQIPQKEGGLAIINQTTSEPVKPDHASIILDIDVFDNKEFSPNSPKLLERIEKLRHQKNVLFQLSITKKTEDLIS